MIDLGRYKNQTVTIDDHHLMNRHISIFGDTGCGKTVVGQRIVTSAVEHGATVIALDIHGVLADDQIFLKHKAVFDQFAHNIDAYEKGIGCALFTPITYPDGSTEKAIDVIGSITEVLSDVIKAGSLQRSTLRKAVQLVYDAKVYENKGIRALDTALANSRAKEAAILRDKLYFTTAYNVFVFGPRLFERNRINIFRLSRFDLNTQVLIAEMLLAYLWRLANAGQFKSNPVYVWIDEYQNLPAGKTSMLARIMSEGRRMGLHLILSTQMNERTNVSVVQQKIHQCGTKLYFKPPSGDESRIASLLDPSREIKWAKVLKELHIGEFIADGQFRVDGIAVKGPLRITTYEKTTDLSVDKKKL